MRHLMRSLYNRWLILAVVLMSFGVAQARPYSVPPPDAPELAKLGPHSVGVRDITLTHADQPDLPKLIRSFGLSGKSDRSLRVTLWYPATPVAASPTVVYTAKLPASSPTVDFSHSGIAVRDAAPVAGQRYPLVIVSHGFGGWGSFMTYLTENLASKGYVVAAIDHADIAFKDGGGFAVSFGSTMVHRMRDQRFVLSQLQALADGNADPVGPLIDKTKVAVVGYSMGGYGALATAGAGFDGASSLYAQLPKSIVEPMSHGNAEFERGMPTGLRAVVLMAPWGGQASSRAWTPAALASVNAPVLMISGEHDDISDHANGVSAIFGALKGSDRAMLVYQNARHNIGGNPAPAMATSFSGLEYFDEPVWRKDRITAINQHFVTAFLDQHLKGSATAAAYLNLPTVKSNDAKWDMAFGQSSGARVGAGEGDTAQYWRGFQRRWALGLELHRKPAGQ